MTKDEELKALEAISTETIVEFLEASDYTVLDGKNARYMKELLRRSRSIAFNKGKYNLAFSIKNFLQE